MNTSTFNLPKNVLNNIIFYFLIKNSLKLCQKKTEVKLKFQKYLIHLFIKPIKIFNK